MDVLKEPYKSLESSSNRKDDRPGRGSSFIATYSTHSRLLLLDRTHPEYCTPVAHLRVKSGFSFIFGPAGGFAGKRCKVDGTVGLKFVQNLFDKTYRIYIFNPKTLMPVLPECRIFSERDSVDFVFVTILQLT